MCQSLVRDSLITRFYFVDPDRCVLTRLECTLNVGSYCLKFYAVPSWPTMGDLEVKVMDLETLC